MAASFRVELSGAGAQEIEATGPAFWPLLTFNHRANRDANRDAKKAFSHFGAFEEVTPWALMRF